MHDEWDEDDYNCCSVLNIGPKTLPGDGFKERTINQQACTLYYLLDNLIVMPPVPAGTGVSEVWFTFGYLGDQLRLCYTYDEVVKIAREYLRLSSMQTNRWEMLNRQTPGSWEQGTFIGRNWLFSPRVLVDAFTTV